MTSAEDEQFGWKLPTSSSMPKMAGNSGVERFRFDFVESLELNAFYSLTIWPPFRLSACNEFCLGILLKLSFNFWRFFFGRTSKTFSKCAFSAFKLDNAKSSNAICNTFERLEGLRASEMNRSSVLGTREKTKSGTSHRIPFGMRWSDVCRKISHRNFVVSSSAWTLGGSNGQQFGL